jgi:hypothetical protein
MSLFFVHVMVFCKCYMGSFIMTSLIVLSYCRNPSFRLMTKTKGLQGCRSKGNPGAKAKVLQLCTNHLVWVVCRRVWVSEACQLFLVPSRSSNTALYPLKCGELGSGKQRRNLLLLPLFSTWTHIWVLWEVGSASHIFSFTITYWHTLFITWSKQVF